VDSNIPVRFVVCGDGSTDNTVQVLQGLSKEIRLKLISDPRRKGCSRAVIDGMRTTESEWVCFIDSNGSAIKRFW
jgi:glycosyltransferase involved in cell wall biosynthesis